ncbi:hypothetical protein BJ170DRAFT_592967 [Xylariales sp. AK1849]|nr:hypothetical protein BJ170DRAFT_592967 [Xylariales sp. AK1849]
MKLRLLTLGLDCAQIWLADYLIESLCYVSLEDVSQWFTIMGIEALASFKARTVTKMTLGLAYPFPIYTALNPADGDNDQHHYSKPSLPTHLSSTLEQNNNIRMKVATPLALVAPIITAVSATSIPVEERELVQALPEIHAFWHEGVAFFGEAVSSIPLEDCDFLFLQGLMHHSLRRTPPRRSVLALNAWVIMVSALSAKETATPLMAVISVVAAVQAELAARILIRSLASAIHREGDIR